MTPLDLHITPLENSDNKPYDLLELADPSRAQIDSYLNTGTCHIASYKTKTVGVVLLIKVNETTMEIKNIAVKESEQGKGIGKALLRYSEKLSRKSAYKKLIIGTGNTSFKQLELYQKEGFEMERIEKNFFIDKYPKPIFENGIQCKHLVVLEKNLIK